MDKLNSNDLGRLIGSLEAYAKIAKPEYQWMPQTVFALLDELERAAERNVALGAELEQYRKDAERLEWMLAEQCIIRVQNGTGAPSVFSLWWVSLHEGQREWYATERDAIDAAMAKEGGANG